ncbi:MAG: beta-galactosidase [Oscillospiraceae bacterium]|nr:beta-galactosidase [Oscillospiraceae bacterium]
MDRKQQLIFGSAYYEEYLPYDRLEQDMQMMVDAGFNTIRIAESTWSTEEPRPGEYDFSRVDRVIDAAQRYGLNVIVGTPTYAIPHWLAKLDPDALAVTAAGRNKYGPRQNMDISNPTYRYYAEGIIKALVKHTCERPNVIGFQIDNETKHYGTAGPKMLILFQRWMKERFGTIEKVNDLFGLRYWSNSVTCFEDLPDPTGAVNASYALEFAKFQRILAEDFLLWQSDIVKKYKRDDQFITQNFDYEWILFPDGSQGGYSGGIQPDICHYKSARAMTLIGTDIYFFDQDRLTGREIAFGGDLMRPLRYDNYLVLESQAQAFKEWLPYPGQLTLMAMSHLASGACGVMYWHWHSIHNGPESYWKGILSHDFAPNPTYDEIRRIGQELKQLAPKLAGLKKDNRIAIVVNTESINALKWFPTDGGLSYNDVLHWVYDALYNLNIECDIIFSQQQDWSRYDVLIFPQLYCAHSTVVPRIRAFLERGGTVFATFRSFFADKHARIFPDCQPHGLTDCFGMTYNQFTKPVDVTVDGVPAEHWMELLKPDIAEVKAKYNHRYWGEYAALTRNTFGKGHAWYLGTMVPTEKLQEYLLEMLEDAGIQPETSLRWPLILRSGVSREGRKIRFLLNYSQEDQTVASPWDCIDLRTGRHYRVGDALSLGDWGAAILEEDTP